MIKQNVFIFNHYSLYEILDEIKVNLSFDIIMHENEVSLFKDKNFNIKNSLIISKSNNKINLNKNLDIIGLMCLPPKDEDNKKYFLKMKSLSEKLEVNELSMGMSNDYLKAAKTGSTFLRIGSKIFGERV